MIKINEDEFHSVDKRLWDGYKGTLLVTDADGCRVWPQYDWAQAAESAVRVGRAQIDRLYSTVGAGDAVHAAFTLARWVRRAGVVEAARFGQAAAAAAVSSPGGTRDLTRETAEKFFSESDSNH